MRFSSRTIVCAAMGLAVLHPANCQDSAELPKVTVLGCEEACAKWTNPKAKGVHEVGFPHGQEVERDGIADAFVAIRMTITADGRVKDPTIVKLVGPAIFGRFALEAVKDWEYEPATADGVPAERPNWYAELQFAYRDRSEEVRVSIYEACNKAQTLLAAGKYAEADAVLIPMLAKPRLTFYELAIVSLLLSMSHGAQKDYAVARDYAVDATLLDAKFFPDSTRETAFRQRIKLEAATGQFGEALLWVEKLKALKKKLADDDPEILLADRIKKLLVNPAPIRVMGRISTNGTLYMWDHMLLRRMFAFPVINGKLSQLQLSCDQKNIVSAVTATAEWHVPNSWSNCFLRVEGDPGTTFQLAETNE